MAHHAYREQSLSSTPHQSNQEFRAYRKVVAWGSLSVVASASVFMMISVGVSINRQRNAVVHEQVSHNLTSSELQSCHEELNDVSLALEKHLESAYHLLAGSSTDEAGRWIDEGEIWRRRWRVVGERCRLLHQGTPPGPSEHGAMASVHEELGSIQATYSRELLRFGKEIAPRLNRLKSRLDDLGGKVWAKSPKLGDQP